MSIRVLVTGGREYADAATVHSRLDWVHASPMSGGIAVVIHGACTDPPTGRLRGADRWADEWARAHGVPVEAYPAEWGTYGKAAGPIRNRRMLVQGNPELVLAFPGGTGTAHMVKLARQAGVPVVELGQ
jgi:hypothetical protein